MNDRNKVPITTKKNKNIDNFDLQKRVRHVMLLLKYIFNKNILKMSLKDKEQRYKLVSRCV